MIYKVTNRFDQVMGSFQSIRCQDELFDQKDGLGNIGQRILKHPLIARDPPELVIQILTRVQLHGTLLFLLCYSNRD